MSVPGMPEQPQWSALPPVSPPPQPPAQGVNGFAIAALICGILAIVPAALICGIVALYQISKRGGRGRGMAIGGLVAAALWVVALVVALTVFVSSIAERDVFGRITEAGYLDEGSLQTGDCLDDPEEDSVLYRVVPCGKAHNAEVVARFDIKGSDYPGQAGVERRADAGCKQALDELDADVDAYLYFSPDRIDWALDARYVLCFALLRSKRRGAIS